MKYDQWCDIVKSMGTTREDAQDIVSEVILRILKSKISHYEVNDGYTFVAMRNEFLTRKRNAAKKYFSNEEILIEENDDWYKGLKSELKLYHQLLIQIIIIDDIPIVQLAKETNISYNTLKKDLKIALTEAKRLIDE